MPPNWMPQAQLEMPCALLARPQARCHDRPPLPGTSKPGMVGQREADFAKMYGWLDKNYPAAEYVQHWQPFNHPQLGAIEIGGVDSKWWHRRRPTPPLGRRVSSSVADHRTPAAPHRAGAFRTRRRSDHPLRPPLAATPCGPAAPSPLLLLLLEGHHLTCGWVRWPQNLLSAECKKNTEFSLAILGALPAVTAKATATALSPDGQRVFAVAVELTNSGAAKHSSRRRRCIEHATHNAMFASAGFLPTNGSARAIEVGACRAGGLAVLELGPGQRLLRGSTMQEVPHLAGRVAAYDPESTVASTWGAAVANKHQAKLEWVVACELTKSGGVPGKLQVTVDYERGGVTTCELDLGGAIGGAAKL